MFTAPNFKFFREINSVNTPICLLIGFCYNLPYALLIFCSFGIFLGVLAFDYFKKPQYYLYYNLGFTKTALIRNTFILNLVLAFLILLCSKLIG
ncbi:hypothetical protein C723_3164 [Christiangramia flava JLT2011]|uniref:Uncharacterized protein n=1 Tax=Christiangramia flava JLT2011 TaxID=1229726 RepID=A0A1L7I8H8_9FLAO|nr:hypothetical protein [Christiangramia flava]APU69513.1 hypothetical protein GRFL_2789 [Christiangramia flava JLT2011]OSS37885.1 hypothetical protein C723_3164 [Christiangramia flava JLT2011]